MKPWLSYLIPQKIAEYTSSYNKYIRINLESGKMKLLVNGSPQSGAYIETLWNAALNAFGIPKRKHVQKVLVLGIAGGTVVHKLHALFPDAAITGVEIDPLMIEIGRKYFSLHAVRKLTMVCNDAKTFVAGEARKNHTYDLVIVDMSFGRTIPSFVSEDAFIKTLKKLMSKKGCVVINYLRELEYRELSDSLMRQLQKHFFLVRDHLIYRNRFFFCSIV